MAETLKIDSLSSLQSYAKRRQVDISPIDIDELQVWLSYQQRLLRNKCLAELRSALVILKENSFESNEPIYNELTAAQLLDSIFD